MRLDKDRNLPITIVMADVNGLKLINDSFGHDKGDDLLVSVAKTMKKEARGNEILARLGGDEYAIILPNTDSEGAEKIIARFQKSLSKKQMKGINLSVSFGYSIKNTSEQSLAGALIEAENHMYRHKVYESASMHSQSIEVVMNALFEKSPREMEHSKRVSELCEEIGMLLGLKKTSTDQLKTAGLVHDIGKIGIDEGILNKSDYLTKEEYAMMKKHSESGWRILKTSSEFAQLAQFILEHHEKWDGSGYPHGIQGENISLEGRIIGLADAYDAMTSKRSYGTPRSKEEAINELKKHSGSQFDPAIAKVFIQSLVNK